MSDDDSQRNDENAEHSADDEILPPVAGYAVPILVHWSLVEIPRGDTDDTQHHEGRPAEGGHHHPTAMQVERERGYTYEAQRQEANDDRDEDAPDGAHAAALLAPDERVKPGVRLSHPPPPAWRPNSETLSRPRRIDASVGDRTCWLRTL
nr:hypothetical protein [Halomicroarcula sp. YJ-61-S]